MLVEFAHLHSHRFNIQLKFTYLSCSHVTFSYLKTYIKLFLAWNTRYTISFFWSVFLFIPKECRKGIARTKEPQSTFSYCNDVVVTSPSISPWHCWYIVNETYDDVNLRYQPDIRILRSDFNIVMTSSWYRTNDKKSARIVYHVLRTSPADIIRTFLYGLICNSKGHVLPTSWGRPKDVLIWL